VAIAATVADRAVIVEVMIAVVAVAAATTVVRAAIAGPAMTALRPITCRRF